MFFKSSARLVDEDIDGALDIYDARSEGGIAAQNVPVSAPVGCLGDECQGAYAPTPPASSPATTQPLQLEAPPLRSPLLSIGALTSRQRSLLARTGRLTLTIALARPGRVTAIASARLAGHTRVFSRVTRTVAAAGTARLTIFLTRGARVALARSHTPRLTVSVTLAGSATVARVSVVVKRPARGR